MRGGHGGPGAPGVGGTDAASNKGTKGESQPGRSLSSGRARMLVVFSGDARAPSTLAGELRARGAEVTTIDTA
eukprot:3072109-Pleurochrysis_carterae.AAC.1